MSQPVLVKIYGSLSPIPRGTFDLLAEICAEAMPGQECVTFREDMLALSFEGIWFPMDDFLETLKQNSNDLLHGKIDFLDLENWRMTRYEFESGKMCKATVPLNNVLDYSGF